LQAVSALRVTVRARAGERHEERGRRPRVVCQALPDDAVLQGGHHTTPVHHPLRAIPGSLRCTAAPGGQASKLAFKQNTSPLQGLTVSTRQAGRSLRHFACPRSRPCALGPATAAPEVMDRLRRFCVRWPIGNRPLVGAGRFLWPRYHAAFLMLGLTRGERISVKKTTT
jgi:hypothetical protein